MIQRGTNVGRRTRHYTTINSVRASDITRRSEDEGKTRIRRGTNMGRMTRHFTTVNLVRTIHIATRSNDEDTDVTWTTRHYITINLVRTIDTARCDDEDTGIIQQSTKRGQGISKEG